jgi:hypothetical protein
MLKAWKKLLNTECIVIKIGNHYVYPIFRNGSTSLFWAKSQLYIDHKIQDLDEIQVLVREPSERFVSGINQYAVLNNMNAQQVWQDVKNGNLVDRHFAPQAMWLLHLYKFYKGKVTLRHFDYITELTNDHIKNFKGDKVAVEVIKDFVHMDYKLMHLIDKTVKLEEIIKEIRYALS